MRIGELSALSGVSARALRHYEDVGILVPDRSSSGYRDYSLADVTRVAQIRALICAGMGTSTIKRYFDCVRTGDRGTQLQMCPDLRAELDLIAEALTAKQAQLQRTQEQLRRLTSTSRGLGEAR
ncbi:MerR family transcriptional regulator [Quadrisphaera sp. RL12-1S]|nr:MerR family transcriptional regulator [Quadrisphaera sp. RL12-1S]MBC3762200.1 MerR family transcriptional regulator [Quadrisphaera sp. RL12-1S]